MTLLLFKDEGFEALQAVPKERRKDSLAAVEECYCTRLFQMEQDLAAQTPEERYRKRLELERLVLDALLAWANEVARKTAPKSALGRGLHYLLEQWPTWALPGGQAAGAEQQPG